MITTLKTFFAVLVPLLLIDGIWLSVMNKAFYAKNLGPLISEHPVWAAAAVFYLLYAAGLAYLVVMPSVASGLPWTQVLVRGAVFGLVAYGTYDLTNMATLAGWSYAVTFVDLAWGAIVTGAVATISYLIIK